MTNSKTYIKSIRSASRTRLETMLHNATCPVRRAFIVLALFRRVGMTAMLMLVPSYELRAALHTVRAVVSA